MDRRDVLTWLRRPPPEAVQLASTGEAWLAPARNRGPPAPAPAGTAQAVAAVPRGFLRRPAQLRTGFLGQGLQSAQSTQQTQSGGSGAGKRIGREQLATLEAVFQRTRHPTVSSS